MQNIVLIIHLFLAVSLIGIVLLQRSEGGGLGMGGGGGAGGGAMSSRSAATALGKATWILAIGFICTSIALTVISAADSAGGSVLDDIVPGAETAGDILPPTADDGGSLLPVAE